MTELALAPLDVSAFTTVSLDEVVTEAAAMVRVDRKYLVGREVVDELLPRLGAGFRALSVAGRSSTSYRSTYFDTADLTTARAHLQRRRRRWKVRSRLYVEDGLCRIEVKTRDGRGATVKTVAESTSGRYGVLGGADAAFVSEVLEARGVDADVRGLHPTMEVTYRRSTLADTANATRVTLDWQVACRLDGDRVWLDDATVLVETKGVHRLGVADRVLADLGVRPRSFSKYASAASILRADLADNDVRALHGRHLHSARLVVAG